MDRKSSSIFKINSNGRTGVLKTDSGEYLIYSFPENDLITTLEADGTVMNVKFSSSGNCFAVHKINNQLEVFCQKIPNQYSFPISREAIYDWAISDDGKTLIILRILFQNALETDAINNGAIEVWSLPAREEPMARYDVPLFTYGRILANGSVSKIAVESASLIGNMACLKLLSYDKNNGVIEVQNEFKGAPLNFSFPIIYKDWIWMTTTKNLMGWEDNDPKFLPGELREKLIFSLDGKYLLVYKIENIGVQKTRKCVFRVIDLSNLNEIKNGTVSPEPNPNSSFVLSKELELFEVCISNQKQIETIKLKWE